MKNLLTSVLILAMSMAFLTYAQHTESKAVQEQVRDGVFIHISHGTDDPHRMAG